ncbi:retrovirus-related pol polyprotein from transposon TNT 1-94 [Tanacetum coccineum]
MKEGSALKDHFDALNSTLMDLKNVKVKTDDEDVASSIVTSQPQSVGLSATGATGATRATRVTGPDWEHIEHTKAKEKSRPREPNPQDTCFKYTNEDGVLHGSKGALVVMKETKGTSSLYTLQVETITRSQRKSEAFEKFKHWKVLNENQTGKKIYRLRIDNGLEFCSREFDDFCRDE